MSRFKVGDIITRCTWADQYKVVRVHNVDETYDILNLKQNETVVGWWYNGSAEVVICNSPDLNKSLIENKIAVMYKRFENRKNHV